MSSQIVILGEELADPVATDPPTYRDIKIGKLYIDYYVEYKSRRKIWIIIIYLITAFF